MINTVFRYRITIILQYMNCDQINIAYIKMQFGDEQEVLYFIAPTDKEKKLWMSTLKQGLYKINIMHA